MSSCTPAFQSNAFQFLAFQICEGGGQTNSAPKPDHGSGGGITHYTTTGINPKKAEELRQIALAEKLVEAQELRLEQIKLEKERSKQSKRQLIALNKEYQSLMNFILAEQKELIRLRNQEALLILSMASPFLSLGGLTMH